jgi:hypothetical protein
MSSKLYETKDNAPATACESAVAYRSMNAKASPLDDWNPNAPFCGTQEEWWDHFHRIENGNFTPWAEHQKEFEAWKKTFLANRAK